MTTHPALPRAGAYWYPLPEHAGAFNRVLIKSGGSADGVVRYWCGGQLLQLDLRTFLSRFTNIRNAPASSPAQASGGAS